MKHFRKVKRFMHKVFPILCVNVFWNILAMPHMINKKPTIKYIHDNEENTVDKFWNKYTIIDDRLRFVRSYHKSEKYLEWRFSNYPLFKELMQLWGNHDNEFILDYGCGPGNDLAGFLNHTKAKKIIGIDVSEKALKFASKRLRVCNTGKIELIKISDSINSLPLENNSIDYIFCEGVLHHVTDPLRILKEFYRILKPNGTGHIMVYNKDSIYFHLYTAYVLMVLQGKYPDLTVNDAFSKSTDSEYCPISRCYKPDNFIDLCNNAGLECNFKGGFFSKFELDIYIKYFDQAINDKRLDDVHRKFLFSLKGNGYPVYSNKYAGVGGVYKIRNYPLTSRMRLD